jgi:hypothetical protein
VRSPLHRRFLPFFFFAVAAVAPFSAFYCRFLFSAALLPFLNLYLAAQLPLPFSPLLPLLPICLFCSSFS